jgi:malonyl-CoA O-methyltransferase
MSEGLRPDKRLTRRSFERAARRYDSAAVLQREVCQRMLERLQYIKHEPRIFLDAGSGTGFGSRALRKHYPHAVAVALDIAPAMLRAARGQVSWWQRTLPLLHTARESYVCGDVDRLPLKACGVDMVWSNLALQWSGDVSAAFAEMHRVLAPGGLLMFSTFGPDTLKELRHAFGGRDGYNHVNRFIDMHDIGDMLLGAGFAAPVVDMEYITMTYDDVRSLLRELKTIGAHSVVSGRRPGLMGKAQWQAMERAYEAFRRDGRLPATFEVVYGHAWVTGKEPAGQPAGRVIPLRLQRGDGGA